MFVLVGGLQPTAVVGANVRVFVCACLCVCGGTLVLAGAGDLWIDRQGRC